MILSRALFVAILLTAVFMIVRAAFRRDRILGWLVTSGAFAYLAGALLMGAYLSEVRNRNYLAPDEVAYQQEGQRLVEGWRRGERPVPVIAGGYPFWNAAVVFVWGPSPVPLRLANAVAGTAGILVAFLLGWRIFGDRATALVAATLVLVSPSLLVWGMQNLKERPLGVLVMIAIWAGLMMLEQWRWRRVMTFAASLVLLGLLRHYYAAIIGWVGIAFAAVSPLGPWRQRAPRLGGLVLVVGVALQLVTGTFLASGMRYETLVRFVRIPDGAPEIPKGEGEAPALPPGFEIAETSGRAEPAGGKSPAEWARSAWFVLFGRFEPVGPTGRVMAVALFPEWLLSFALFPLAGLGVWCEVRRGNWRVLFPSVFIGGMLLLLIYLHGDAWSTIRFRSVFWPVLLVVASGGVVAALQMARLVPVLTRRTAGSVWVP